jgi:UDP-N-acetylmuramoyl-tripeptide--D-alanyl-D-alanine ligase
MNALNVNIAVNTYVNTNVSPLWTTETLTAATGKAPRAPITAHGVSIDTRTLRPGDLFVALVGENSDGHAHVATALAKGAAGAVVHTIPHDVPADAPLLVVDDTLSGLHQLGAFGRSRFAGRVVAVTGSVGKTTTKEMLRTALSALGLTHAAEASYNNQWGVPLTLARLPADADFCVVEIGMNHAGEIAPLARLARPHVAVITTVERAHIGHLGSLEAIADEKAAIMQGLSSSGVAILPADNALLPRLRLAAAGQRIVTFGTNGDARLEASSGDAEGSDVAVRVGGQPLFFHLAAPGRHMAMNALAALAAVDALELDTPRSAAALAAFMPMPGRGQRRPLRLLGGEAILLDESYNASSSAVRAALDVLSLQPARRRLAVLGDMLELGDSGPAEHASLAPDVTRNVDLLFACGPLMRHLFDAVPEQIRAVHVADSSALAPIVAKAIAPGDAVLVKGSLGSRMRVVVQAIERETR